MKISDIGEFGLIASVEERFRALVPEGYEGIGDDCAVLPLNGQRSLVVTKDLLVEGVHFRRAYTTPRQLGYKSLAVNLSDIAAMGATPSAIFLGLALPADTDAAWCDEFFEGFRSPGIPLLGGDTTASPDRIVISVTALGTIRNEHLKLRSTARPGDLIAVTAPLGDSAAGLRALAAGWPSDDADTAYLIERHNQPYSFVSAGEWLGARPEVHAMMDVSDGLASDLPHILRASGCAARIRFEDIPMSEPLARTAGCYGYDALSMALCGGEDYVLLFTVSPESAVELQKSYEEYFDAPLFVLGEVIDGPPGQVEWMMDSKIQNIDLKGFTHF